MQKIGVMMLADIYFLALNRARLGCCLHKCVAPQQISQEIIYFIKITLFRFISKKVADKTQVRLHKQYKVKLSIDIGIHHFGDILQFNVHFDLNFKKY